jgi:hypothetical protein
LGQPFSIAISEPYQITLRYVNSKFTASASNFTTGLYVFLMLHLDSKELQAMEANGAATETKKRHRSPSYPTIGLREAVERLDKFYRVDGKAGAPPEIAVKHMGYSTAHGAAYSALSALKKFGLVAESNGRIVPSQRALEIVNLQEADPRRLQAVKDAAVAPTMYRLLIDENPDGLPSNDALESELVTYKDFNPNAVKGFVKDFKDTLEFAGLSDLAVLGLELKEQEEPDMETSEPVEIEVSQGPVRLPPGAVGVPAKPPTHPAPRPRTMVEAQQAAGLSPQAGTNVRQDVFSLTEGPVTIQWPATLSPESFEDLGDWLDIVKRKIGRSVAKPVNFGDPNMYTDKE